MKVLTEPNLRRLPRGFFQLQTSMEVEMNDGTRWIIPAGFKMDFASSRVGRWNFLGPDAALSYASILHDYLYYTGEVSRKQADRYFREGLKSDSENVSTWNRVKGFIGVRLFGRWAWKNHRSRDEIDPIQDHPDPVTDLKVVSAVTGEEIKPTAVLAEDKAVLLAVAKDEVSKMGGDNSLRS